MRRVRSAAPARPLALLIEDDDLALTIRKAVLERTVTALLE